MSWLAAAMDSCRDAATGCFDASAPTGMLVSAAVRAMFAPGDADALVAAAAEIRESASWFDPCRETGVSLAVAAAFEDAAAMARWTLMNQDQRPA